jgi:DNA-binding transcriptional ArsR family regulator
MSHSPVNLNAKNPTKVSKALIKLGQASSKRLAEVTKMPRGSVTSAIKALYDAEMIHIGCWELNKTTMPTRIYKWGPGQDIKEPIFISKKKVDNPTHTRLPWPRADVAASWLRNSI